MATIINTCSSMPPDERFSVLENSEALEKAYAKVAQKGSSQAPNAEDEVYFHYLCFVKSQSNGRLYELDGDRRGPTDRGAVLGPGEDVLAPGGVEVIRDYMAREGGNANFSLMALVCRE